ncbi:acyl-CoA synthetase [Obba rivulosa]|uniref:Acyl-CoA synthetase n=1 Tax=Obba rivulosa TaxID=1052685 RepID=A0A8E2J3M2_9APHY|nr:acyl-CoA synthetase [Obba rivulosa]
MSLSLSWTTPTVSRQVRRYLRRHITLSAVAGPLEPPLVSDTLPAYFTNTILAQHAERQALVSRGERARAHGGPPSRNMDRTQPLAWDFAEFDGHINALARGLLDLDVRPGDRVGVVMGNNSAYACLQWACARVGAILVTLNPAYRLPELVSTLNLVGVSHLFLVPRLRSSAYISMLADALPALRHSAPGNIQEPELPTLRHLVVVDNTGDPELFQKEMSKTRCAIDFREVLVWREDGPEARRVQEIAGGLHCDDVINLQFTSGTTGAPKAVSLTHHNLLNNALSIGRCMRLTPSDVVCNVPPLFHCFGLVLGNLTAWAHGSSIVYPAETFDARATLDALMHERCTALHGVPTHLLGVLDEVRRRREGGLAIELGALRTGIAAGSPIPMELMKRLIEQMNLRELTIAFGMTETSPVSFQTTADDPLIKRVETVGRVHPHVRAKLVDSNGEIVPVGAPGEILIAGYLLQKGYWNDEAQTAGVMQRDEEGTLWMHTGDEGIMDEEGYLRVVSRIKDIIIRGGENLFPVQIENVLTEHPAVREAAVVSVPDPRFGETVGAWIVRAPHIQESLTRAEIKAFVTGSMNPQNAPTWVWFAGEDGAPSELPKTASGKVMKHVLRGWSKDLAGKGIGAVGSPARTPA